MKEYTDEYLEHIRRIIEADHAEEARKELAGLHPADIAELYKNLSIGEAEYLYRLLDEETAADVLMELDEDDRLKLIADMPAEEIAKQIDYLDTDDAEDLIKQLDEAERDEIISRPRTSPGGRRERGATRFSRTSTTLSRPATSSTCSNTTRTPPAA